MLTRRLLALAVLPALFAIGCGEKDGDDTGPVETDDADGDGYGVDEDCDDDDASINPGANETCEDGVDNNCDGNIDEACPVWVDAEPSAAGDDLAQYEAILRTDINVQGEFNVNNGQGEFYYTETQTDLLSGDESQLCDSYYTLQGTEFSGDCDGCDFAFAVTATLEDNNGYDDCDPSVVYTFTENTIVRNPTLAWFTEYVYYGYYGAYYYNDVFANGISFDYTNYGYGYYAGPYWRFLAFTYNGTPSTDDTVSYTHPHLEWDVNTSSTAAEGDNLYYYTCTYTDTSYAYAAYDAPSGNTSTLSCGDYYVDAWEVDLSDASEFRVTVDTIAANTAADLAFWINDDQGCSVVWADDNFDCTFEPTQWQCPSALMDVDDPGTYTVYVKVWGSCTGDEGAYDISAMKNIGG